MAPEFSPASPLFVVLNAASGHDGAADRRALIAAELDAAGRRHHITVVEHGKLVAECARRSVQQALAQHGAVVAAGGDGTLNAVAQAAHASGCPMGVLPQGTFNYFSRTHGIPSGIVDATRALLSSRVEPVQVGLVNDHLFLVNASLGLYPTLLEDREEFKRRFGRHRLVALVGALVSVLRQRKQLRLRIELGGVVRQVRTPTLFVGNNRLQLEQVGIPEASALDHGRVAAVMLKPVGSWAMLRLLLRGAFGSLGDGDGVESFHFQRMTVTPALPHGRRGTKVAADGEVFRMRAPLDIQVAAKPLYLLKPIDVGVGDLSNEEAQAPARTAA